MDAQTPLVAWSASRVATFRQCPRQFYHVSVAKRGSPDRVDPGPPSPEMEEGTRIHEMLEKRVGSGTPFPPGYEWLEPVAAAVTGSPGKIFTEFQMALDADLRPCGFKDWSRAWVRAVADVLVLNAPRALVLDYKTGRPKSEAFQLKLSAAVVMQTFADIDRVTVAYVWLKHANLIDAAEYTRDQLPDMWEELLVDPRAIQEHAAKSYWPARPGRHCAWCPVNSAGLCEAATERPRG